VVYCFADYVSATGFGRSEGAADFLSGDYYFSVDFGRVENADLREDYFSGIADYLFRGANLSAIQTNPPEIDVDAE